MKNLKYLKVFEAFESSAIKSILGYIGGKVSQNEKQRFLDNLKRILLDRYDFPIDKISDDDVRYMSAKKALQIQVPEDYDIPNPYGVYALKFWFAIDKGYLGFTGVGKSDNLAQPGTSFTSEEIDHIKNEIGLTTGKLIPVTNYSTLKTGDQVVCYFSEREEIDRLALGTIIIEDDVIFGIQNVADGGAPSGTAWRQYGRLSWNMGSTDSPADDHSKLHLYVRNGEDLVISGTQFKEYAVNRDGYLTSRKSTYSMVLSDLENADFAIVVFIDGLIGDETVTDIRKIRSEEKKGATALMSDSEIKKLNYQRYLSKVIELYGLTIKTTESELRNLQNMINSFTCGELIIFALMTENPSIPGYIDKITRDVKNLINSSEDEKSYYLDQLSRRFKSQKEDSNGYAMKYKGSLERVKISGDEKTNDLINQILEVSRKIQTYLVNSKIETLDELLFIRHKLESIRNFVQEQSGNFSDGVSTIIRNFYYNDSDVNRGAEYASRQKDLDKDVKIVNLMERYVDTILR